MGGAATRLDEGMLGCCTMGSKVEVNANCQSQASPLGTRPEFDAYVVVDRPHESGDPAVECGHYGVTVSL